MRKCSGDWLVRLLLLRRLRGRGIGVVRVEAMCKVFPDPSRKSTDAGELQNTVDVIPKQIQMAKERKDLRCLPQGPKR